MELYRDMNTRALLALLVMTSGAFAQELAYPLTTRLQSRVPAGGVPADAYYLPGNADISCFESTPNGTRYLCLNDTGTIVEWSANNRVRQLAAGFLGPIQARVAPDGTLYVLDLGRGTLSQVATNGTVTRIMGAGSDRVIRDRMDPRTFDLPLFTLSRDTYRNSAQLAIDPAGNPYLGFMREEIVKDNGQDVTNRFFYIFRLENRATAMVLHWNGSATIAARQSLPEFNSLSIDKDRNIFFAADGQLYRLTPSLQYTPLIDGRYTVLNSNRISSIVQTDDGNIFLHSRETNNVFRLAFAELRVDLDAFTKLNGHIARQGGQLIGLDLNEKRLVRYRADTARLFVPEEVSRLLRYIPVTGANSAFRAAFDNPVSVSTDNAGQVFIVEGGDGAVYRISANGTLSRIARSTFNPDGPPPPRPTSENFDMNALPYPIVAVANDPEGRLYLLDRNCNFLIQTAPAVARRAREFTNFGGCTEAFLIADQAKRIHIAFATQGEIQTGTGDPVSGDYNFSRTFGGSRIWSMTQLPSGDLLALEGPNLNFVTIRRINSTTRQVVTVRYDDSLRNANNFRPSSLAVDISGRLLAVSCCTAGSSNEAGRRFLYSLQLTGTDVLIGQTRPVTFFDSTGEAPERLFSHPRGILIRTNQSRIFYFEDAQFRNQSAVGLPNRQTWTYTPDAGTQELAIPVNPGFGPTAFRSRITCDRGFERFVRLVPSAAVAPTQLRLALDTLNAPSRSASCRIELLTVDTGRVMANTAVDMVPDPVRLAEIPTLSLLEELTPFRVDPAQETVTRSVRVFNNAPDAVEVKLEGTLPDGIVATPATLTLEPKQSGDFTFTLTPQKLFRQVYELPLRVTCATCKAPIPINLSFQITGRTTAIDISAEAALVDIAGLNSSNLNRMAATTLVLTGLDTTDVNVTTDFGNAPAWFTLERGTPTRMADGKLVVPYEVVLNRQALPTRQASNIVVFSTQTLTGVARRFLTVFFYPEGSTVQRLFESGSAGATLNMSTTRSATVSIPVFSRATAATVYSTYTLGGDSGTVSVPSVQGIVGQGANELTLQVSRAGNPVDSSETKDIVVVFANGERLIYSLNVLTSGLQPVTQSKSDARMAAGACSGSRLLISPREPGLPFTVVKNVGLRFVLQLTDECNQRLDATDRTQLRFTTEPANGSVTVTSVGNGLWEVFWKPERNGEGVNVRVVAVRGVSEREIYAGTLTITGRVADSVVPSLRSFRVVDAVSYQSKSITAPGAFISIFGENMGTDPVVGDASSGAFPTELGGVQVLFNGKPAPLLYTSPGQVNLQVPFDLENSEYRMTIRRGELASAPAAMGVGSASPAIATINGTGTGAGQIFRVLPDQAPTFATPDNPAKAGETILIVATGLGATNPFFDEGRTVPGDNVLATTNPVQVSVGGALAGNASAYLAPGFIGIYFVTGTLPLEVPAGEAVPLIVRVNGVESQTVTMSIQ